METLPLFFSLFFSFSADFFFLLTPFDLVGVLLFLLVQCCHRSLIGIPGTLWLRDGFSLAMPLSLIAFLLTSKGSLLLLAALIYFCFLLCNFIYAWQSTFRHLPVLFCVCLTMLLICDLHVGLYNLPRFLPRLPAMLQAYCSSTAYIMIWLFYIPSQFIMLLLFFRSLHRT